MEKKEFTFGGVTETQFDEAVKTVCSYFNGIAAAPITPDIEPAIIMCGVQGLLLHFAQNAFREKLAAFKDVIEQRNAKEDSGEQASE